MCTTLLFRPCGIMLGICRFWGTCPSGAPNFVFPGHRRLPQFFIVDFSSSSSVKFCDGRKVLRWWNKWKPLEVDFHDFGVDFSNNLVIHDGWAAIAVSIVHFSSAIFKLLNPLQHFRLTHYTWPINTTQLPMNFGCSEIVCVQKPHHCSDFATGGIFD